jgi:hypothetical protein
MTQSFIRRVVCGQHQSFCKACLRTVALAAEESHLATMEDEHVCELRDLLSLERAKQEAAERRSRS